MWQGQGVGKNAGAVVRWERAGNSSTNDASPDISRTKVMETGDRFLSSSSPSTVGAPVERESTGRSGGVGRDGSSTSAVPEASVRDCPQVCGRVSLFRHSGSRDSCTGRVPEISWGEPQLKDISTAPSANLSALDCAQVSCRLFCCQPSGPPTTAVYTATT